MLLHLDFTLHVPIYQQICNEIVRRIVTGELQPGELLPPIRTLAEDLGVNMMTVSKAYQLLKQEGYILTDRRSGAVVAPRESGEASEIQEETVESLRLCLSELRLAGMSREQVLSLCEELFDEGVK